MNLEPLKRAYLNLLRVITYKWPHAACVCCFTEPLKSDCAACPLSSAFYASPSRPTDLQKERKEPVLLGVGGKESSTPEKEVAHAAKKNLFYVGDGRERARGREGVRGGGGGGWGGGGVGEGGVKRRWRLLAAELLDNLSQIFSELIN